MMHLSSVFCRTLDAYQSGKYTIISNYGGTRSGKTYSTLQLLYLILISDNHHDLMISVVSRSVPHLKRGCIRDFETILDSNDRTGFVDVNKTDMLYTFKNNNRIEFFSADNAGKLHGAARDILYVNECNYINEEKIKQLFVRTTGVKFIDYNPSAQFWIDNYKSREDFIEFHGSEHVGRVSIYHRIGKGHHLFSHKGHPEGVTVVHELSLAKIRKGIYRLVADDGKDFQVILAADFRKFLCHIDAPDIVSHQTGHIVTHPGILHYGDNA